jgi:tetratricopeptide (TPR) repeat protein
MASRIAGPLAILLLVGSALLAVQPALGQAAPDAGAAAATKNRRGGPISDADLRVAAASMDEGRAALERKKFREAIQIFTKVLAFPESRYSAEAEELLGFAYQKSGELAQARTIYEDFLRRYPSGEQSERVRQRLAGIITAQGDVGGALRPAAEIPVKALPVGRFIRTNETTWNLVGGVSSFYIRDDAFVTARDTSVAPNPALNADDVQVHQNEILTTLDLLGTWNDDHTSGRIRFNGGEEHRFYSVENGPTGEQVDELGVSQASIDMVQKDLNLRVLAGRQTYNGDGVFGRFDGALFSWQPLSMLRLDVIGGSPSNSRYNLPFTAQRYFYGAGIGLGQLFGGLDASIYYNEERGRWLVDREAIGTDIRYSDPNKFAFGNVDYDLRFHQLNEAVMTGSWTLPNTVTVYGGADYRRVPFLSSWNVLLNQPFSTIYDFLKNQIAIGQPLNNDQVEQLALAETPLYKSAMLGFLYPITNWLSVSADATIANLSRTITPASLLDPTLAELASGNEYYFTAQLIATDIFKPGDMYIGAFHYAEQSTNAQYVLDFNTRYPITGDLMVAPRLRLGYSTYSPGAFMSNGLPTGINLVQYTVMPSILVDYNWTPNLTFEAEIGTQWTLGLQPGLKTTDTEFFATVGFRYAFDFGGSKVSDFSKPRSPAAAAICRYSVRPDGSCATPTGTSPSVSQ